MNSFGCKRKMFLVMGSNWMMGLRRMLSKASMISVKVNGSRCNRCLAALMIDNMNGSGQAEVGSVCTAYGRQLSGESFGSRAEKSRRAYRWHCSKLSKISTSSVLPWMTQAYGAAGAIAAADT